MNERIYRGSEQLKKQFDFLSKHFAVTDYNREVDNYNEHMEKHLRLSKEHHELFCKYETSRNQLVRKFIDDNSIDLVKYISNCSNAQSLVEQFFVNGCLSISEYEQIKDILWKSRPSQVYKMQQHHIYEQ